MKKIAVVIPTYNRRDYLRTVLDCLKKQNTRGFSLIIIVVVDGSTDGTIEMLETDFPGIHIILGDGNWWFTKSLNRGCEKAQKLNADYILTLNDDCYFDEKMVQNLFDVNVKRKEACATGAITLIKSNKYRVTFSGTKDFIKWRAKLVPYLDNRTEYELEQLSGVYPTHTLMTRGLLFPLEIGAEIQFFDEKTFPQYGSDDDFVLRLKEAGYSSYVSYDAQIFDNPHLSSIGSTILRPRFKEFFLSFFNYYSVNSLVKSFWFIWKYGNILLLPFNMISFLIGTIYANYFKYRKTSI
jgi:GT2 family glycosyltransferase